MPVPHGSFSRGPAALLPAFLCLLAGSCGGDSARGGADGAGSSADGGHPSDPGKTVLAGEIELAGELASLEQASVFVIGFDAKTNELVLVDKLDLSTAEPAERGVRRLPFALGTSHSMTGGVIDELELEVRVDLNGMVDGPDDMVGQIRTPVELGDLELRLRLGDEQRTEVPLDGPVAPAEGG